MLIECLLKLGCLKAREQEFSSHRCHGVRLGRRFNPARSLNTGRCGMNLRGKYLKRSWMGNLIKPGVHP
jgi:hypothetical protein